jgi:hypothetical protein
VRRSDADQARARRDSIHDEAFGVDRYRGDLCTVRLERGAQRRVARILERNRRASGRRQHAREQVEGLLCAGGDHDVLGITGDGAREGHVLRDRRAQRRLSLRIGGERRPRPEPAHRAVRQAAPGVERETREIGDADLKGDGR